MHESKNHFCAAIGCYPDIWSFSDFGEIGYGRGNLGCFLSLSAIPLTDFWRYDYVCIVVCMRLPRAVVVVASRDVRLSTILNTSSLVLFVDGSLPL